MSVVFSAYGLVPINSVDRFRFPVTILRGVCLPAVSVFTHWAEGPTRISRKRFSAVQYVLYRGRKPVFSIFRADLAFLWLAWYYRMLFHFAANFSLHHVDECVEKSDAEKAVIVLTFYTDGFSDNNILEGIAEGLSESFETDLTAIMGG